MTRQHERLILYILGALLGVLAVVAEGGPMNAAELDAEVSVAAAGREQTYMAAKRVVIAAGDAVLPLLSRLRRSNTGWAKERVAEIFSGWINTPDRFELAIKYANGELPGRRPITGRFMPPQRIRAIQGLGPGVTPVLIELVWKLPSSLDASARASVFGAIGRIRDPRAVEPLIALLDPSEEAELRRAAAGQLGALGDGRANSPLRQILRDRSEPEPLRTSAATSLGLLGNPQSRSDLEAVLLDEATPLRLRKACAAALARLADRRSAPALVRVMETVEDLTLLQIVIEALGESGDPVALKPLRGFEGHADEFVRAAAVDAGRFIRGER